MTQSHDSSARRSSERRTVPIAATENSERFEQDKDFAFAVTEAPPTLIRESAQSDTLVIPLVRVIRESDAEVRAALEEHEDLIELTDADIVPIIEELEAVEKEMSDVLVEASKSALRELGPDDGRKIDIAVDYLEHRPGDIGELDGLDFTKGEILAVGLRLARRNPEAFLDASADLDFMLTADERIAITQDILETNPRLFNRAVWQLRLSNNEIRNVLLDAPNDRRTTALRDLEMPGTVGGREVEEHSVIPEDHRKWYERLSDHLRGREVEESITTREVNKCRNASRELQLALESAFPKRINRERERADIESELHGRIEALDDLGAGSANAPMWIRYKDRPSPAVYKPRNREAPLRAGIPTGTYANREWLAYQIDKALQLDLVPPTVLRDGPEGVGAVQDWKVGAGQSRRYWLRESGNPAAKRELAKLAFFDMITQNSDRHVGNWLIAPDGRAVGIDHGSILGKPISAYDGIRSWPMWAVEGEDVPDDIAERVEDFGRSREVQVALYRAFEAALGDDAGRAWQQFASSLNSVMSDGFPTSEQLKEQGNGWVGQDAQARDIFAGGAGD